MTKVEFNFPNIHILAFSVDWGFPTLREKLCRAGHTVPNRIGDRLEELKEDLARFPATELLVMDPGASIPKSYTWVTEVQKVVPEGMPIMLFTWDAQYWRTFCKENDKRHQVVSYGEIDLADAVQKALQPT